MIRKINLSKTFQGPIRKNLPKPNDIEQLKKLRYIPDNFIKQDKIGSYEDFMEKLEQNYPKTSLKKFVEQTTKKENLLGEGRKSKVYSINGIDDYVIKISKNPSYNLFSKPKPFNKVENDLYGFNFGQAIADNGEGISIHMRTQGKEYGIKNWAACFNRKKYPTTEEVNDFINKDMAQLSEFPQSSFDDLVKKVSFIHNTTDYKFDFYNPNNFLIDYKNKKINIVNISKINEPKYNECNNIIT